MGNNFAARLFSHAVRNACIPQRPITSVAHQVTIAAERNLLSIPSSWCVNRPIRGHGQSAVYRVKSIDDISYAHFFLSDSSDGTEAVPPLSNQCLTRPCSLCFIADVGCSQIFGGGFAASGSIQCWLS